MKIKTYFDTILAVGAILLLVLVVRLQVRILSGQQDTAEQDASTVVDRSTVDDQEVDNDQPSTLANQMAQAVADQQGAETGVSTVTEQEPAPAGSAVTATVASVTAATTSFTPTIEPIAAATATALVPMTATSADIDLGALVLDALAAETAPTAVEEASIVRNPIPTQSTEIITVTASALSTDTRLVVRADSVVSAAENSAVGNAAPPTTVSPTVEAPPTPFPEQEPTVENVAPATPLDPAPAPQSSSAFLEVTISVPESYNVNARYTTDTESDVLQILPLGSAWPAIGRSIDTAWLQIVLSDGTLAWVFTESVVSDSSIEQLPITLAPPLVRN